ncbi:MAG: hypothetical protein O4751_16265 [Trichodesmium sp. St2_bin6]|nr:hypothetical protein [Trichodesmium sp. MAG_R01]MDE5070281.1 hypothetical protein [Trichodesmium sp. St4_bin8_1]MDE5073576.1 hypothetical protein [Trichodesmium sp. St5_bin8]MDE5079736.1 hypothetical protein [Trichodesmium sp. St2_bin6]MDE5102784.1 hypothetical protein [Trichodesmium sp. St19_bin2]
MNYINQSFLPEMVITELVFQVYRSGILTQDQRKQLKDLFLYHNLTEEDTTAINRLIHAIRRGWLKMV